MRHIEAILTIHIIQLVGMVSMAFSSRYVSKSALLATVPAIGMLAAPLPFALAQSATGPAPGAIHLPSSTKSAPDFVPLVHQVKPAVVSIVAHLRETNDDGDGSPSMGGGGTGGMGMPFPFPFPFQMMPMMPSNRMIEARGSGFVISSDGYIVTNNHVVKGATKVAVKFDDGTVLPAKIIGRDPETDLALLHVKSDEKLPYLELGNSDNVQPGQWIVAVGNPYGLGGTVTAGIVSALGRDLHSGAYNDFIQIDAPINRGNSGGPLITLDGKVVGVNSMIMSPNGGGSIGIGFAIPSETVRSVVEQLRKTGHVVRGYLGVVVQNITPSMAKALNLPAPQTPGEGRGVLVASVSKNGPADKAGLKSGDVIGTLNDREMKNAHELAMHVVTMTPGSTASLGIMRDGKPMTLQAMIVKSGSHDNDSTTDADGGPSSGKIGISLAVLSPQARQELGLDSTVKGALVAEVAQGSAADHAGLRPGDVIIAVGTHPVASPHAAASLVQKALSDKQLPLLHILRDGQQFFVAVSPDSDGDGGDDDGSGSDDGDIGE